MKAKNADAVCQAKYCPVNNNLPTVNIKHREQQPVNPKNDQIVKYDGVNGWEAQIDQATVMRNRQLRRIMDQQRQAVRDQYNKQMVAGPAEATKIRLIMTLQKFQTLGIEYSLLNQYFTDCFKTTNSSMDYGTETVISSMLVFDKLDLVDSNACYTAALASIRKTQTTNFAPVISVVDGLTSILKDLRE